MRRALEHLYLLYDQVQDAIHAPHIEWETCGGPVYINPTTGGPGNDQSVASTLSVLPNVIEKSERVAIVHGLAVRRPTPISRDEGLKPFLRTSSWLLKGRGSLFSKSNTCSGTSSG